MSLKLRSPEGRPLYVESHEELPNDEVASVFDNSDPLKDAEILTTGDDWLPDGFVKGILSMIHVSPTAEVLPTTSTVLLTVTINVPVVLVQEEIGSGVEAPAETVIRSCAKLAQSGVTLPVRPLTVSTGEHRA